MVTFKGEIMPKSELPVDHKSRSGVPVFTDEVELALSEGGSSSSDYTYITLENPANALDWGWLVSSETGNLFLTSPLVIDGIAFVEEGLNIVTTVDVLKTTDDVTIGSSGTQGELEIMDLTVAGLGTSLCVDAAGSSKVGRCTSSQRFKQQVEDLDMGLKTILALRPVSFKWNVGDHVEDMGFIAEEVSSVDSRLATFDEKGAEVGVKYRRMSAVLTKAMQEQQKEIEKLQKQNDEILKRLEQIENQSNH